MEKRVIEETIIAMKEGIARISEQRNRVESLEKALFTCLCSIDTMKQAGVFAGNALDTTMVDGIIKIMNEALNPKGGDNDKGSQKTAP